jgi:retron-type reverse transcriptase
MATTSKLEKGVRQGDPLSPILFNIVVDMLAILISKAKDAGLFGWSFRI